MLLSRRGATMSKRRFHHQAFLLIFAPFLFLACQDTPTTPTSADSRLGESPVVSPAVIDGQASTEPQCKSLDSQTQCLGLKVVTYQDDITQNPLTTAEAQKNLDTINQLWGACNIQFTIDTFLEANPQEVGLSRSPAQTGELSAIRKTFEDPNNLLLVVTENWDRSGTLGATSANAWATLPGTFPSGIVMETGVATFGNIIAHELGHLLGLDHSNIKTDLMSPVIYDDSTQLPEPSCQTAQSVIREFWSQALRGSLSI
jgi:hypothetical protein